MIPLIPLAGAGQRPIRVRSVRPKCGFALATDTCLIDPAELKAMRDCAQAVSRSAFSARVNSRQRLQVELDLGYAHHPRQGRMMARDAAVTYYRSVLHGARCYFFVHGTTEYVFTLPENDDAQ